MGVGCRRGGGVPNNRYEAYAPWCLVDVDSRIVLGTDPEAYPVSEDSALLLSAVTVAPGERFLEVGVGGGLVSLHAARLTDVVASDVNPAAVKLAARSAAEHGLTVRAVCCDLMSAFRGPFDVVAFNPPYLDGNPADRTDYSWAGGAGGSEVAIRFLEDLPRVLAPRGRAYLLLANHDEAAEALARSRFRVRVLASRHLFFERLDVLELRPHEA